MGVMRRRDLKAKKPSSDKAFLGQAQARLTKAEYWREGERRAELELERQRRLERETRPVKGEAERRANAE